MTQIMARFTHVLDSRSKVPMTGKVYLRAIVPIGVFFSLSLICGNLTYMYLSVSFIQMLKATTPVAVLITGWIMGTSPPNYKTLGNVSIIVLGVIIASAGEIKFIVTGVLFQLGGIAFEAVRLNMVQSLLSSAEFKMDPLVSLYYFAPACAIMNGIVALVVEVPKMSMLDIQNVGYFTLLANAMIAFMLNVSVVFLVCLKTSYPGAICSTNSFFTDWQNLLPRPYTFRCAQGHPPRLRLYAHLPRPRLTSAILRLLDRPWWSRLLQARSRQAQGIRWCWWSCLG